MNSHGLCLLLLVVILPLGVNGQSASIFRGADASTNKPQTLLESLVVEPSELGMDAERVIEGLVVNVKQPSRVIANNHEQDYLVTSSEFRNTNLRFASHGMRSWMNVSYKITDENKRVYVFILEFEDRKQARKYMGLGTAEEGENAEAQKILERKSSISYTLLQGPILLKATWVEPRTAGIDTLLTAYRAKLLGLPALGKE